MQKVGIGLKLQDRGPSIGRFFPTGCSVDVRNDTQTVVVSFNGHGYGFMPVTKRFGFTCNASVEYEPDFYLGEEDVWVWGKHRRNIVGPTFQVGYIEQGVIDMATAFTPLGGLANMFGGQIVSGELTRGFTVVMNDETESKSFALGILQPPSKPMTPYNVSAEEIYTFANETIELNYNQRDFLGPFEIADADQQLLVKMFLQGPQVEILVINKVHGDQWRDEYIQGRPLGPPPGPVLGGSALNPGAELRTSFRLPAGQYYIVVDHTQSAGNVMPPPAGLLSPVTGGPVARISYTIQLDEL
jgi:hypothetical protein